MTLEQEILAVINQIVPTIEKAFHDAFILRHPGHPNQKTHGNRFGGYAATKESLRRLKDDKGAREKYKETARKRTGGGSAEGETTKGFKEAVGNMSPMEISKGEYEQGLAITQRLDKASQKRGAALDKAIKEKDPEKRKKLYEESRKAGGEWDATRKEYRKYISEVSQKAKGRTIENVVKSKEPVFITFTGSNNAQVAIRTREPRKGKFTVFGKTHTGREINATFDLKKNSLKDVMDQLSSANKKGAGYQMVTHSLD